MNANTFEHEPEPKDFSVNQWNVSLTKTIMIHALANECKAWNNNTLQVATVYELSGINETTYKLSIVMFLIHV